MASDVNIRTINRDQLVILIDQANHARHEMFAADVVHMAEYIRVLWGLLGEAREEMGYSRVSIKIDQVTKGARV
jgi:hypothetical protein